MALGASSPNVNESDLVKEAQEKFAHAVAYDKDNRDAALEDINFIIGNQWDALTLRERQIQRRPTLVINRLRQFVNQVTGEVRRNSPSIHCTPGDGAADPNTAQVMEGLIRSIERRSCAKDAYVLACEMAVIAGIGHWRIGLKHNTEEGFDLDPYIEPIRNIFSVLWDPDHPPSDDDAKHCFVYERMTESAFKALYPNAGGVTWPVSEPWADQIQTVYKGEPLRTVCEYWRTDMEPFKLMLIRHDRMGYDDDGQELPPTGEETVLTVLDPDIIEEAKRRGFSYVAERQSMRKRVVQYLLAGSQLIAEPVRWPGKRIPIFSTLGEQTYVGSVAMRHGLVRWAKDPQRLLNWSRSQQAEHASLVPKTPITVAAESIKGFEREWQESIRKPLSHLRYNAYDDENRQLPAPRRPEPIGTNPANSELSAMSIEDMKAALGIYDSSLGAGSRETSGVAIQARDAQTDTATFVYLDNLTKALEQTGRELVNIIPKTMSTRQQVRILGRDDAPAIISLQKEGIQLDRGAYDIVVKTGPAFESRRAEARNQLVELLRGGLPPQLAPVVLVRLAKLADWDDAEEFAAELQRVSEATGLIPPMQPQGAPPGMPPGMPGMGPQAQPAQPQLPAPSLGAPQPVSTGAAPARFGNVGPSQGPAGQPGAL